MSTTYHTLDAYLNGKKLADSTATKTKPNLNTIPIGTGNQYPWESQKTTQM